jgi:hypothetical protein
MSRRVYEKTQKGNPYRLPLRGHVFPSASISRFTDGNGLVEVYRPSSKTVFKASPTNPVFCAMRAWDKRAETGYMKEIEDDFQELAGKVIDGKVVSIGQSNKLKVDRFFALWNIRATFRDKELADVKFNGITGDTFTKDQEEGLENVGVLFIRQGGTMPAHRFHGVQIQMGITRKLSELANIRWGIVRALEGQFIVPDFPNITMVPVAPALCFCGTRGDLVESGAVVKGNVIAINRHLIENSREYYFANDLRMCV